MDIEGVWWNKGPQFKPNVPPSMEMTTFNPLINAESIYFLSVFTFKELLDLTMLIFFVH
jgi:hypothetical protein